MLLDKDIQKRRGKFITSPEVLPQILEILTSLDCIIMKVIFDYELGNYIIYCFHEMFPLVSEGCYLREYIIESTIDENYIPKQLNRIRLK